MAETTANEVIHSVGQVSQLYYRLMLLVAPAGGGKTTILQAVAQQLNLNVINNHPPGRPQASHVV